MLKNENIICISSIDWDFIWQGHQEIMSAFAKNGNRVLFIENTGIRSPKLEDVQRLKKRIVSWFKSIKGFRKEMENLYVYSPVILPFPYSRVARFINKYLLIRSIKRWMRVMGFSNPIIWTFLPTGTALDIINNIEGKLLIYYCIANFKNIILLGKKDFEELPYYINEFDVCIIPYLKSGYTATVYPTKLNEYHALGKPVVSTDLPEVKAFNDNNGGVVYIGKDYEDFSKNI